MHDELLEKIKLTLPGVDYVADLFDLRFIWASQRTLDISGYSEQEFLQLRIVDVLNRNKITEDEFRKIIGERIGQKSGTSNGYWQTKAGESKDFEVKYVVIEFNNGWFMAGEAINHE